MTGHRSTVTLVKNYDLKLEAPGLHEISHAIGTGQVVAMGERADLVRLEPRRKRLNMVTGDGVVTLDDSPAPKANKPADDGHVSAGSDSLAPNTMVPGSRSMLRPVSSSSGMPGMINSSTGVPGMISSSTMGVPGMMNSSSGISGMVSSSMRVPEMNSSGSSRYEDPSFILMESAGRFVGSLGKSIMEGAAPMLENLLRANREQHMQVMVQRGNMEIEKVEVIVSFCLSLLQLILFQVKTITKPN